MSVAFRWVHVRMDMVEIHEDFSVYGCDGPSLRLEHECIRYVENEAMYVMM